MPVKTDGTKIIITKPKKLRSHNEWFRSVSLGNRKSCPCCKSRLEDSEAVWSWGEYVCGKWRTVKHFCKNCFEKEVAAPLVDHASGCGCEIVLNGRGESLPSWLKLEKTNEGTNQCAKG